MKNSVFYALALWLLVLTPAHAYNMSEDIIKSSHLRSKYFEKPAMFDFGMNYQEFTEKADKRRGVVVHSHGCSGVQQDEWTLKNFYTELGFYFVMLDFHKRGDASASCTVSAGTLTYHDNPAARLPPRVQELKNHVDRLKNEGFERIIITGHSEGGMVVQLYRDEVDAAIIHSMQCIPGGTARNNLKNRYLHLVSFNDPLLKQPGVPHTCNDRPNYTTLTSNVFSHGALADPSWREKIREFLGVKN